MHSAHPSRRVVLLFVAVSSMLAGCMAAPLVAMGMAGAHSANILAGDRGVGMEVAEPDKAKLGAWLRGSKRIALLDSGPATATAAETIEAAGLASPVAAQYGNASKMSPSQQRESMQKACASERADVVISARTGDTRTNRMTYLIGKAATEIDMDVFVLACKTRDAGTVRVIFKFDAAIQGSGEETVRRAGVAFGKAIAQLSTGT